MMSVDPIIDNDDDEILGVLDIFLGINYCLKR